MYWNEDGTTVEKHIFLERLSAAMSEEEWILDGNYSSTMEWRMSQCDTVIFLDYPLALCLDGIRARRGRARSDMPFVASEADEDFIDFVKSYRTQQRPRVLALLAQYGEGRTVIACKSREEADALVRGL